MPNRFELPNRCFACGRPLKGSTHLVDTRDAQTAYVGPDCYAKIVACGDAGYSMPKLKGESDKFHASLPKLYPLKG